ncbi:MAG TPA: hypothetical protein VNT52_17135 [Acidimicrobiales bacterium]|nr:hypothetical protein [Acidimicrobiales bacterium]
MSGYFGQRWTVKVFDVIDLATAVETPDVRAVAVDVTATDDLADAISHRMALPVLRPLSRRLRILAARSTSCSPATGC